MIASEFIRVFFVIIRCSTHPFLDCCSSASFLCWVALKRKSLTPWPYPMSSKPYSSEVEHCIFMHTDSRCVISHEGMLLQVQESKSMQANAYLPREWFQSGYRINFEEHIEAVLDMKTLDSCICLMGKDQQSPENDNHSQAFRNQPFRSQFINSNLPSNSLIKVIYPQEGGELVLRYVN